MTRLSAKVLSSEKRGDQYCVTVKLNRRIFGDHLIVSTGNSATQTDHVLVWIYGMFVIVTENMGGVDAPDLTRGRFERNKPEMFQYLGKFIPTFLDKIFSELGEKTLSVI